MEGMGDGKGKEPSQEMPENFGWGCGSVPALCRWSLCLLFLFFSAIWGGGEGSPHMTEGHRMASRESSDRGGNLYPYIRLKLAAAVIQYGRYVAGQ